MSECMPDAWVVPYACMTITMCIGIAVLLENPPPLLELKLMYSYVIELADSESDLGFFFSTALVSEILAFYHLLEYARGRPGRTPLSLFFYSNFFSKILNFFLFIMFMRALRVYVGYLLLRVYVGYLL